MHLYKLIKQLIVDSKERKELQKNALKNFYLTDNYISKKIDNIRSGFDKIPRIKKKELKILHITNFNERHNGRLFFNTGRRINNGFIRLNHSVLTISDRDIINKNKNLTDLQGTKSLQKIVIDSYDNFHADCIILGHADSVSTTTLDILKSKNKDLKICQWFLDPIGKNGPDYFKNTNRIQDKASVMDATFLTTSPDVLSKKIDNSYFIPNPCDNSFEILKNYENECQYDVFFAMSHGVHRGELKKGKFDDRELFINKLKKLNKEISFDIYGMNNVQPVWGDNFIKAISKSSMGINLSRGEPVKYYSSDRIAQLLGNGLLTFINKKTCFNDFLSNKEIIFYKDINDLSYKIDKYKKDIKEARIIAKNGRDTYLKNFNSTIVADFILSKTFDYKSKNKFIWEK